MTLKALNLNKAEYRISTGVKGLDQLLSGGFKPNSVNVIVADTGCGKSTFCWQYTSQEPKKPALFISLEQPLKQVLSESKAIGIEGFSRKNAAGILHFIYGFNESSNMTAGKFAQNFLTVELPKYLDYLKSASKNFEGGLRIAIDPITPLLFEIESVNEQRNVINRVFQSLRDIGTAVITLEKGFGEELTRIPLFLADTIIDLDFVGLGSIVNRTLKVRKFRGSSHSEKVHPLTFEKENGLIVHSI
ncbi:MAG: RAD55 family ATPase [Candidatus Hodarchaeales archaeon]